MAKLKRLSRSDRDALQTPLSPGLFASVEAYLLSQDAAGRSPKTILTNRWHLDMFVQAMGDVTLAEISSDDINRHLVQLRSGGAKPNTVHGRYRTLAAFFHWCERDDRVAVTPLKTVAAPKLPQITPEGFTDEQVRELLAVCDQRTYTGARDYALIATLVGTGLRISECLQLRKGDVIRGGPAGAPEHIRVIGKGDKERLITLLPQVRDALSIYLRLCGAEIEDALWISERGNLTAGGAREAIQKRGHQAGIQGAHPHRFRRTALAGMARAGLDPLSLQQISGHSDLKMLRFYIQHREQERANNELERLNHLNGIFEGLPKAKRRK